MRDRIKNIFMELVQMDPEHRQKMMEELRQEMGARGRQPVPGQGLGPGQGFGMGRGMNPPILTDEDNPYDKQARQVQCLQDAPPGRRQI